MPNDRLILVQITYRNPPSHPIAVEYLLLRPEGGAYLVFDVDMSVTAKPFAESLVKQGLAVLTLGGRYRISSPEALYQLVNHLSTLDTPALAALSKSRQPMWLAFGTVAEGEAYLGRARAADRARQEAKRAAEEAEARERASRPVAVPLSDEQIKRLECERKKLFRKPFDPPDFYCM